MKKRTEKVIEKVFWICKKISCLAIAAQKGLIITTDEFKKISK